MAQQSKAAAETAEAAPTYAAAPTYVVAPTYAGNRDRRPLWSHGSLKWSQIQMEEETACYTEHPPVRRWSHDSLKWSQIQICIGIDDSQPATHMESIVGGKVRLLNGAMDLWESQQDKANISYADHPQGKASISCIELDPSEPQAKANSELQATQLDTLLEEQIRAQPEKANTSHVEERVITEAGVLD